MVKFEISGELFRESLKGAALAKSTKPFMELVKIEAKKDLGLIMKSIDLSSVIMSYVLIRPEQTNIVEEGEIYVEPKDIINVLSKVFRKNVVTFETDEERFYIKTSEGDKWYDMLSDSEIDFPTDFEIKDGYPVPKNVEFATVVKVTETPTLIDTASKIEMIVENGKCKLKMGDEISGLIKNISMRCSGENLTVNLDTEYIKRILDMMKGEFVISANSDVIYVMNPRDWGVVGYLLVTSSEE